jgi:hypothetical protein
VRLEVLGVNRFYRWLWDWLYRKRVRERNERLGVIYRSHPWYNQIELEEEYCRLYPDD